MPNPNKHIATIKLARVKGGTEIFLKSEILEQKIRDDASVGPELDRELNHPPRYWPTGLKVYRVVLPDYQGSYSYYFEQEPTDKGNIQDILHLIRAVGLAKGVKITLAQPLSVDATQSMAKKIKDYLRFVYEEYYTDVSIEYNLVETIPQTEVSENGTR